MRLFKLSKRGPDKEIARCPIPILTYNDPLRVITATFPDRESQDGYFMELSVAEAENFGENLMKFARHIENKYELFPSPKECDYVNGICIAKGCYHTLINTGKLNV